MPAVCGSLQPTSCHILGAQGNCPKHRGMSDASHLWVAAVASHNITGAQGEHPKHRGVSDAGLLGTVERYFAEIMPIPRLQQRIDCFIFTRSFEPAMQRVTGPHSSAGYACRAVL